MELIIVTGHTSLKTTALLVQQLKQVGYQHIDPDMFYSNDLSHSALDFEDMLTAKQACLQEALICVSQGTPVILSGDFIGTMDLNPFRELSCHIEFIDAGTASHTLVNRLIRKRRDCATPMSEHWLRFKLFQRLRA
jgi:hypothetical protein